MFSRSAIGAFGSSNLMSWVGFIFLARNFVPPEIVHVFRQLWALFLRPSKLFCVFHIHEMNKENRKSNDLYRLAETYLEASGVCKEADQVVLTTQAKKEKDVNYKLTGKESVVDSFEGVTVWWSLSSPDNAPQSKDPFRRNSAHSKSFEHQEGSSSEFLLKMRKKDKQFVMTEYLDHVIAEAMQFRRQQRDINLFAITSGRWRSYLFKHPSTFDTLAMKPELKAAVKADLDAFKKSEKYFRCVGRAWKRGYLLYGPPGTGKSSLIAAVANYLKYDIYDLELTEVHSNDSLKGFLCNTKSKSIVVIEDIDCSLDLAGKRDAETPFSGLEYSMESMKRMPLWGGGRFGGGRGGRRGRGAYRSGRSGVTLSGLLNSVDGLWSSCTDERIFIFTTNHVEKLDPALIRPGRMDMHIHMSYCSFDAFKQLACTYLSIDTHPCYDTVRRLLEEGALVTPAQVTEHLFGNQGDPSAAMRSLIAELQKFKDQAISDP